MLKIFPRLITGKISIYSNESSRIELKRSKNEKCYANVIFDPHGKEMRTKMSV
jgi:hypothetical protein